MSTLSDAVLAHFPAGVHPLTLVSDPDGLLDDEALLAELLSRGFLLLREPDPVRLRHRVEHERPFSHLRPVVVVTDGELNRLPYDLWQQGQHVRLSLHRFFPYLYYPLVRALSPRQREAAHRAPTPSRRLGLRATAEHLLRHVFGAESSRLCRPAALISWLNEYHRTPDPMPPSLAEILLARLRSREEFAGWPLQAMLAERDAFTRFVQAQWTAYVAAETGQPLREGPTQGYLLPFADDESLQDDVPALLRTGALAPVPVVDRQRLPAWARAAVDAGDEAYAQRRAHELLDEVEALLQKAGHEQRWETWQAVARVRCELYNLLYSSPGQRWEGITVREIRLCHDLDAAFARWLRSHYAPLAVRKLPRPHHVYHVPEYIAYERRRGGEGRVALLVMDGMSLADWSVVGAAWRTRHTGWRLSEQMLLAQVPTLTAISRQALVSGLRPAELVDTLADNRAEPRRWGNFWAREGLPAEASAYARLSLDRDGSPPDVSAPGLTALCLVDGTIDDLLHGVSLGAPDVLASLRVWLHQYSPRIEALIDELLAHGFGVYLTSDHGHVEARGMGQPSEGVTVDARCKRARIYGDPIAAARVQDTFSDTLLWAHDGLLPDGIWVLMPQGRLAFAPYGDLVVTHGGPTLDEVVVPLVHIWKD